MKSRYFWGLGLVVGLVLVLLQVMFVFSQEGELTPEQEEALQADLEDDGELSIQNAADILAEADRAVDMAYAALGIFEAVGVALTIAGVVLGAAGFTRFASAQEELAKSRELLETELQTYRQQFAAETSRRQEQMEQIQTQAERERERTANALLANALIPLGERQYKASDYSGALYTYNRALQLDPDNPVVHQRLGYVHTQSGNLEEARRHYEKAIELEPDFAPALAGLGFVYRRLGERVEKGLNDPALSEEQRHERQIERNQLLNKAEEMMLQALKISPKLVDDDGESWWGVLGGLYKRRGQIDQAIEAYQRATSITPQSSYGPVNLAYLYMKQGRLEEMQAMYRKVERIASKEADSEQGNFWGYADLIVSSYATGKYEQARDALPVALSIAPVDSPYMLDNLIETLRELNEVLEDEPKQRVNEAIRIIDEEMARRSIQRDGEATDVDVQATSRAK